jgi:adenine-specific DNA methylase
MGRLETDRHDDRPVSFGMEKISDLFTDRQLVVLGAAMQWIDDIDAGVPVKRALGLAVSNALATNNKLCGYSVDYGRLAQLFSIRGYSLPTLAVELNPLHPDAGRGTLRQCIERVARSAAPDVRRYTWSQTKRTVESARMEFCPASPETADIRLASAAQQDTGPGIDLCIFDPPYFDFIAYSELSEFYRAWRDSPSSVEGSLLPTGDDPAEQFGLELAACLRAAVKRLHPGRPIAFTYHSANPEAWRSVGIALDEAKLAVTGLWPVRSDGHMGHHSQPGNCEWDLVVCCRRVTETTRIPHGASVARWVKHLAPLKVGETDIVNMSLAISMAKTRYAVVTMGKRSRNDT